MLTMNRRIRSIELTLIILAAACLLRWPSGSHADVPTTRPVSPEVAKVQQEQIDLLRRAIDQANQKARQGLGSRDEVDQLNKLLTETRLRAANTTEMRVTVLKEALATAQAQETYMIGLYNSGNGQYLGVVTARVYRLSIEEQLLEAGVEVIIT